MRLSSDSIRFLLTIEKASVIAVFWSIILKIFSLGMVIETFNDLRNSLRALPAILYLFLPSNLNGRVNMPNAMPSKFLAAWAKTWVAPDPNPPPKHATKITISWSLKSLEILSVYASAALLAKSVFNPVPNPCVNSWPNRKYLIPRRFLNARTSVSAITNEALCNDRPISETIDPPPPPMPITFILALKKDFAEKVSLGLLGAAG